MYQDIEYSLDKHVAIITLNRPDRLNAWTGQMEKDIRAAMDAAAADANVRAIVVTGAGRGFCAGADMNILTGIQATPGDRNPDAAGSSGGADNFNQKFSYMLAIDKPIFMAINGPIAGIGLCFAVFGDFRYMADGAKMTTAFAKRGLIAEHGISWMLPRLIGTMNALDLLCSARTIDAAEAERMGLVRKLPFEGFLAHVLQIAHDMTSTASPRSIGVIKRQVWRTHFQSLAEAWGDADVEMKKSFASEDFKEGVAHFVEKRAPAFTGR